MPPPMHEFVYCVASTMILYAQGSREIFQPEKFLDRTGNRTRHLRIGNSVPLPTRLPETPNQLYNVSLIIHIGIFEIFLWYLEVHYHKNAGKIQNIHNNAINIEFETH